MNRPARTPPDPWSVAAGLLALVLVAQFAASSWLWAMMSGSWFGHPVDYRAVWKSSGFRGLPLDDVAVALNRRLPLDTPIRIGPSLAANDQWAQRLKEGLYPRRVRADATAILDLGSAPLLVHTPQGTFTLKGTLPPAPSVAAPGQTDFGLSWGRVALHALAAFGWGAAVVAGLLRLRRRDDVPLLPAAALAAPVVFGVLGTLATVVQKPLPWTALMAIGIVLALAAIALNVDRRALAADLRKRVRWLAQPETWPLAILSALVVRHLALWPILGWDGRSIWLYRAKQVAFNGFLPAADAANLENYFSHMEYPLLFPTWLAQFAGGGPLREREIAVGLMLLQIGLTCAIWWLSRRRLGRWTGAAFTGALFLVSVGMAERGYCDGFVTTFLACMVFALDDEHLEPFGWLAALGAALTKSEGLVFAGMTGALFLLLHPRFRARPWRQRLWPALLLLPVLAHGAWTHAVGIKGVYAGAKLPTLAIGAQRLGIIFGGIAKIARESNPIAHLPAALGCYVALEAIGRRGWLTRITALVSVGIICFGVAVMLVTPYDVAWQVDTAMGRLLLNSLFAMVIGVLVALAPPPAAA